MKAIILALAVAAGCATAPSANPQREASEYTRTDAQLRAAEQYQALEKACLAKGGFVYVRRSSSPKFPLRRTELKQARCALWPGR